MFPLSFREYLSFRGIEIVPHDADNESLLRHELEAYLLCGGFPEIVLADEVLRPLILEEYSSLTLYRDIDTGLIAAFQAFPSRDLGHKLETLVFLENRRSRKDLFYYANGSEVDLCDAEGKLFVNTCWNLADADTFRREKAAMAFGAARWPAAQGTLLYHEYIPGREREVPGAQAAWRYLLQS